MEAGRLKHERAQLGLTRRELAAATGYGYRSVVAMEQGRRDVSPRMVRAIEWLAVFHDRAKRGGD